MACSKYVFPEDMTIEILKRVPVKPLLRAKSVCKSWLSIISDPGFIKTHSRYQQILTDMETSLLMVADSRIFACDRPPLESPDFKCYLYEPHLFRVIGSCNGIVCMLYELHCYLWNPVTKMCKEVPEFPRSQKALFYNQYAGNLAFYFDTISDDYKVLHVLREQTSTGELPVLQLYSANTNSWKEIYVHDTSPSKVMSYPYLKLGPVINGAVYMCRKEYVVSFHLHTEVCTVLPTPSSTVRYSEVLDLEGSVAVIFGSRGKGSEISVWTLDNIHGEVSWSKKFDIGLDDMGWIYSCLGGGLLYGRTRGDSVVYFLYDYKKKEFKHMPFSDSRVRTFLKYTETLASIEGINHDSFKFSKTVSLI